MSCKKRVTDKAVGSMYSILLKVSCEKIVAGKNNVLQMLMFQMTIHTN